MRLNLKRSGPWIGVGGLFIQVFIAFPAFFTVMPGTADRLNVPAPGIAVILALWLVQAIVLVKLARSRPVWCVYVPVVGLVAYFVVIYAGVRWMGWGG
jgi:hypothetical protein